MSNSSLCVDANLVIRPISLPAAYDAHYLALADWLGGEFWTTDRRLARAVEPELAWVRVVNVTV